jgi:DNA invertase Pin-like site-specific DNA recombinase
MRVSRNEQTTDRQEDHLRQAGCEKIFKDVISGACKTRPGLDEALNYCRPGDTFVVWELDRLGRSLKHLIDVVEGLKAKDINFRVLKDGISTDTIGGELTFHIFGALAEFERKLIVQRTRDGLAAARARGRLGGRPKKMDAALIRQAIAMAKDPSITVAQICKTLGVSRNTYYKYVQPAQLKEHAIEQEQPNEYC